MASKFMSGGEALPRREANVIISTFMQPQHPSIRNAVREGQRICGNFRKGLASNSIQFKNLLIGGQHAVTIAVSRVTFTTP